MPLVSSTVQKWYVTVLDHFQQTFYILSCLSFWWHTTTNTCNRGSAHSTVASIPDWLWCSSCSETIGSASLKHFNTAPQKVCGTCYLYYYIQIPLTCISKSTVHSVYCICIVLSETHNCSNGVGKLKCQWVLWPCKSASYGILSTNNLYNFRHNGLWKIQYKLILTVVIIFMLH